MFRKHSGVICVAMCYILVGISYPVAKEAMESIPTWTFTFLTFLIGLAALFPLTLLLDKTNWLRIPLRDWAAVSVQALFGAVLFTVFLLYGLPSTTAVAASVITSVAPAVVLVLSALFLKEKMKVTSLIAVFLAVVSVIIMTVPAAGGATGHNSATGLLFLALSTLSTSAVIIFAQKLSSQLKPLTMAAGVCLIGAALSLPLALPEMRQVNFTLLMQGHILTLIYYGVCVWALPYVFFFYGIWRVPASTAGMTVALVPVASLLTSAALFGEHISSTDLVAAILIVTSLMIAETKFRTGGDVAPAKP